MTPTLLQLLDRAAVRIGEITVARAADHIALHHHLDDPTSALDEFSNPTDARAISNLDEASNYRPLKSAPNLRRGWILRLDHAEDLLLALDCFYPAALALATAQTRGKLTTTPLDETLDRQSGMYAVAGRATDTQTKETITACCATGCLRQRLWSEDSAAPASMPQTIPLLCREACNILVAAIRERVKGDRT